MARTRARRTLPLLSLLLVLGLAAACGGTDESADESSDDSTVALEPTDDSLGPATGDVTTSSTGDAGAGDAEGTATTEAAGPVASDELCEALREPPNDAQVALFPEELRDDAQEYVDEIRGYQESGEVDELPAMSEELAAFVSTCE